MSVQSAAIQVLKEAGKPLHATEITERILKADLWKSDGKTPEATISAQLYTDIKKNGDKSPFIKVGPQTFALRESGLGSVQTPGEEAPRPSPASSGFSFTDCAQKVLEEFGSKMPMHYKEITEKALEKGWLVTSGKTPEASMYAQVIT